MPDRRFFTIEVLLTEPEYTALRSEGARTASGTAAEALRLRAGMTGRAYGSVQLAAGGDPTAAACYEVDGNVIEVIHEREL